MSLSPSGDPIKGLQIAALKAAAHVAPGQPARQVVIIDATGAQLLRLAVPPTVIDDTAQWLRPAPGWVIGDDARFDGRVVPVGPSRLKLLQVLAGSDKPLSAKELAKLAFDRETDEENVRYHVRELRKELALVFSSFEGDLIANDGGGYRLVLK